ncbi:MAG: DUF262 domain-containing protein [bacterium]
MSSRSVFDTPTVPRLVGIIDEVRSGGILIPAFQRPFVWDDERRLLLLDSVLRGMPIGSFLVWRSNTHKLQTIDTLGPFPLQSPPEDAGRRTYLIDGHQRLTTLYAALTPLPEGVDRDPNGPRWPIYYDLEVDLEDQGFRLPHRRREPPKEWIRVSDLLSPTRLFAFQRSVLETGRTDIAERAEDLAGRLKDYQVPIVPLISEDLGAVTKSFVRVNRQGVPMAESMMIRALGFVDYDLSEELARMKERLAPLGWGDLDDQTIVNAIKIRSRLDVYKATPAEVNASLGKTAPAFIEELGGDFISAIRWLGQECGVWGPRALPYTYQLIALVELMAAARAGGKVPYDEVRRWFWRTTYTGHFTGMTSNHIRDAVDGVVAFAAGDHTALSKLATAVELPRNFEMKSTRARALALLMLFGDQEGMPVPREARLRFGREGAGAVARLYPKGSATDPANRVVAPFEHLVSLREALAGKTVEGLQALLHLYAIPAEALEEGLATGNPAAVLDARWAILLARETRFVESMGMTVVVS